MLKLNPISQQDIEAFIKGKGFKYQNKHSLIVQKAMSGFCSLKRGLPAACIPLILRSDDMEPKRQESLCVAAKNTGILKQIRTSTNKNKRSVIVKWKGGVKVF